MPAARRDNALQLSTSKDAQERIIIDDDIWEIGGRKFTSFSLAGSKSWISYYPCLTRIALLVTLSLEMYLNQPPYTL